MRTPARLGKPTRPRLALQKHVHQVIRAPGPSVQQQEAHWGPPEQANKHVVLICMNGLKCYRPSSSRVYLAPSPRGHTDLVVLCGRAPGAGWLEGGGRLHFAPLHPCDLPPSNHAPQESSFLRAVNRSYLVCGVMGPFNTFLYLKYNNAHEV